MSEATRPSQSPTSGRVLNRWSLIAIVIASMIGAGVFTTSGFAIADLKSPNWVMLAWVIGGLIALCGAVSYGNLARLLIDNGGEYLFLSRYVHPSIGFIAGWVSFLAGFTGAGALAALALEGYVIPEGQRPEWLPHGSIAILMVLFGTLQHAFHTQRGAGTHNFLVVCKLALVGLFIVIALASIPRWDSCHRVTVEATAPTVFALATSVMWISLSYCGFNAAIYVAAEAEHGWSDVAGSMIKSTIGVTIIYLLLNAIFLYGPSTDAIVGQQNIAVIAARSISGESLALLVRVTICLALASSVSSTILAGPRVYAKMAEDGVFPTWFRSSQSPPTRSVILQGIAMAMVVSVSHLQDLLGYLGLTLSLCSAATVAVLVLRPHVDFRLTKMGTTAAWSYLLMTCVIAGLAAWHRPGQASATLITVVTGWIAYQLMKWVTGRVSSSN